MEPLSIVIATREGREREAERARASYVLESPEAQIIVVQGDTHAEAWERALPEILGELVHFASDELEAHPGWFAAARAAIASQRIPAPMLWGSDGTPPAIARRDWSAAVVSEFPTMTRSQLALYGIPPLFMVEGGVEFVVRSEYAFTLWRD